MAATSGANMTARSTATPGANRRKETSMEKEMGEIKRLQKVLKSNFLLLEDDPFMAERQVFLNLCSQMYVGDLQLTQKYNLMKILWDKGFYEPVKNVRAEISKTNSLLKDEKAITKKQRALVKEQLAGIGGRYEEFLYRSISFFRCLVDKIVAKYKIHIPGFVSSTDMGLDLNPQPQKPSIREGREGSRTVEDIALYVCYNLFVKLGDLTRYVDLAKRELKDSMLFDKSGCVSPASYYLTAEKIAMPDAVAHFIGLAAHYQHCVDYFLHFYFRCRNYLAKSLNPSSSELYDIRNCQSLHKFSSLLMRRAKLPDPPTDDKVYKGMFRCILIYFAMKAKNNEKEMKKTVETERVVTESDIKCSFELLEMLLKNSVVSEESLVRMLGLAGQFCIAILLRDVDRKVKISVAKFFVDFAATVVRECNVHIRHILRVLTGGGGGAPKRGEDLDGIGPLARYLPSIKLFCNLIQGNVGSWKEISLLCIEGGSSTLPLQFWTDFCQLANNLQDMVQTLNKKSVYFDISKWRQKYALREDDAVRNLPSLATFHKTLEFLEKNECELIVGELGCMFTNEENKENSGTLCNDSTVISFIYRARCILSFGYWACASMDALDSSAGYLNCNYENPPLFIFRVDNVCTFKPFEPSCEHDDMPIDEDNQRVSDVEEDGDKDVIVHMDEGSYPDVNQHSSSLPDEEILFAPENFTVLTPISDFQTNMRPIDFDCVRRLEAECHEMPLIGSVGHRQHSEPGKSPEFQWNTDFFKKT
eukprot:Nk52_evm116s352 gene=Nk52_evmTU116s352